MRFLRWIVFICLCIGLLKLLEHEKIISLSSKKTRLIIGIVALCIVVIISIATVLSLVS